MLQLLLEDLPFGDVVDGADHPQGLTSLPTNHFGLAVDPAQLSTRPQYTMFEVVGLVFVVRCADSLPEQIPVVRVHHPDQLLEGRSDLAGLEAVDAECLIRPPHLAPPRLCSRASSLSAGWCKAKSPGPLQGLYR